MDFVVVPCWHRPEMLWYCLRNLARTPEAKMHKVRVLVSIDRRQGEMSNPEIERVIREYDATLNPLVRYNPPHRYVGNSSNVLLAYKQAYEAKPEFIFLVEEDIIVGEDFFRWHHAVQKQGDWMCSIAVKNRRQPHQLSADPAAYLTSKSDYQSWGVCWRREKLAPVLEHCRPEYFRDLGGYLARRFPGSRMSKEFTEQDGMIQRVLAEQNGTTAWPYLPRAFHCGFYGYNRSQQHAVRGSLKQRIERLGYYLDEAPEKMAALSQFPDVEPCYLGPLEYGELRRLEELP